MLPVQCCLLRHATDEGWQSMKDDLSCVDVFQGAASHANRGPVREEFDSSGMDSREGDRGGGTGVDNVPDMSGLCTIMTNYLTRIRLKRGDDRLLSTLCWSGYITCMLHRVRAIAANGCHMCTSTVIQVPI